MKGDNKNPGKDKLIVTAILFAVGGFAILFLSSFKKTLAPALGSSATGSATPSLGSATTPATTGAIDTTGWAVDPQTGFLISPTTGNLYDPATGNIYDATTGQYLGNIADGSSSTDQSQSDSSGGGSGGSGSGGDPGYGVNPGNGKYYGNQYSTYYVAPTYARPGGVALGTKLANMNPNLVKGGVIDQTVATIDPKIIPVKNFLAQQGIVAQQGSIGLSVGGPSSDGPVRSTPAATTLNGSHGQGGYTFNHRHDCGCAGKLIRRNDCGCGKQ